MRSPARAGRSAAFAWGPRAQASGSPVVGGRYELLILLRTPLEGQEVVVAAAASRIASAGGGPRLVDGAPALFRIEEAAGAAEVRIGLAAHGIFVAPALDRELGLCFLEAQAEMLGEPLHVALIERDERVAAAVAGTFLAVVHR